MAGSVFGNLFKISTWGESHGLGIGVVIDGCPAGLVINEEIIQAYLNKRRPGATKYSTPRTELDKASILSGVFEGVTTGTPISIVVYNENQRSKDYSDIANYYRPGHADYTFDAKYGIRDYRGGGRSSGRETIGRVAAGAIAMEILKQLNIDVLAYTKSIGSIEIDNNNFDRDYITTSPLSMPDNKASDLAEIFLQEQIDNNNSAGGIIECRVNGLPAGIGEPVFDKLDANISKALMSIGAVKGLEIGAGFEVATSSGLENNDHFSYWLNEDTNNVELTKLSNKAGGILGGMSDGSEIIIRAAIKPTSSIAIQQRTVNKNKENIDVVVTGRHDPVIVPRAVVVVEAMVAITLVDHLFMGMTSQLSKIKDFYKN